MTKDEYFKFQDEFFEEIKKLTVKKNQDYTGLDPSPFSNFMACEKLGVASSLQGLMVRMLDKFARLNSFAQKGFLEVSNESVKDTLMDLANYCCLTAGLIEDDRRNVAVKIPDKVEVEIATPNG